MTDRLDLDPNASDADLLGRIVAYYHERLLGNQKALAYLQRRGIQSREAIQRFQIGFADRTLTFRLPPKTHKAGKLIRGRLETIGIYRADSGHEHLNGSVVVPVHDADGRVVHQMYGRKITMPLRPGTAKHLFLPGPMRDVWNAGGLGSTVVFTQSLIDALSAWVHGVTSVTACWGVDGFTEEHIGALRRAAVENVVIAFRRDEAGDRAAEALATKLAPEGITVYRAVLPMDGDVNDLVVRSASPKDALDRTLRSAVWLAGARQVQVPRAEEPVTAAEPSAPPAPTAEPEQAAQAASCVETPLPQEPKTTDVGMKVGDDEVMLNLGDRRYRVRGLGKNTSFDALKVNVLVSRPTVLGNEAFHLDTFDIYAAKQRAAFIRIASKELGVAEDVIGHDLAKLLFQLEALQDEAVRRAVEPKAKAEIAMTMEERQAALELLHDPNLLDRVVADAHTCGIVGEDTNVLIAYLAATSRLLERPLAVVIQSTSAAGKSTLMESVLAFVPPEQRVQYSALTGQALFYVGEGGLRNKVLAVAEDEGADRASYALKLLQSERQLVIASTDKDGSTGRLVTREYRVEGPVALFFTSTSVSLDEELANRCLVLTVDESAAQTAAIHRLQRERETLAGVLAAQDRESVIKLHQNAQRLLRPLIVVNPFAPELRFEDGRTRSRRDHPKLLGLIRAVALLYQHQREVKRVVHGGKVIEYTEATQGDIETASRLASQVIGRAKDEVPPHTLKLLATIEALVSEDCKRLGVERRDYRFTARYLRERLGVGPSQLQVHLRRLVQLEYLALHRQADGRGYRFELLGDGGYDWQRPGGGAVIRGSSGPGAGCSAAGVSTRDDSGTSEAHGHHPAQPETASTGCLDSEHVDRSRTASSTSRAEG